jgi:GT2 family glycosyltransferase
MTHRTFHDVTIICVTFQSRELVESLSDTIRDYPNIIVVDNASTDGTAPAVRDCLPHATLIESATNVGFGKACNMAMARVNTPYALLLNPDCDITPDALSTLIDTLQRYPYAGIVSPQSLRRDGKPQKSFRPAFYKRVKKRPYRVPDATSCAQWLHGCCLLLRTHSFHLIDGFDERFFLFYEDDDLCLRMNKAGFTCLIEPAATIVHTGGASSAFNLRNQFHRSYHYARSKHLITRKYLGKGEARLYLLKITLACLPAALLYSALLNRKYLVRWLAWGSAAITCAFSGTQVQQRDPLPDTTRHITQ